MSTPEQYLGTDQLPLLRELAQWHNDSSEYVSDLAALAKTEARIACLGLVRILLISLMILGSLAATLLLLNGMVIYGLYLSGISWWVAALLAVALNVAIMVACARAARYYGRLLTFRSTRCVLKEGR